MHNSILSSLPLQLKIKNEETIKSLDKKVDSFRQAVSDSQKKPKERPPRPTPEDPPEVNMEEAAEELSKLWWEFSPQFIFLISFVKIQNII